MRSGCRITGYDFLTLFLALVNWHGDGAFISQTKYIGQNRRNL